MTRRSGAPARRWLTAWLGAPVLGVVNGVLRDTGYGRRLGEQRAHQVSTGTLLVALTGYAVGVQRRAPLPDTRTALRVGEAWAVLTVAFELGLGRLVGTPWREQLRDWDLRHGRLWPLVPAGMAVLPELVRRTAGR